jgi:hypothetical protein
MVKSKSARFVDTRQGQSCSTGFNRVAKDNLLSLKVAGSNPAGVTTSFVPNPGISGFQPDKRQMRRTLLVRPGHRRLRHQKSACGSRAPIGSN